MKYSTPDQQSPLTLLADAVQTSSVDGNLVIHLVRLIDNAVNVLVLGINLLAHGLAQLVERSSTAMNGVPGVKLVR